MFSPLARSRIGALAAETVGLVATVSMALMALSRALDGPKQSLLLTDGDSVLLPLALGSLARGEAFEWALSPVLFVLPELPLHALAAVSTPSVSASLLLHAVVNVVILYGLIRFVLAGAALATGPLQGRIARIGGAVTAILGWFICCALEVRPPVITTSVVATHDTVNFELASLLLTTTYYSGTLFSGLVALGLTLRLVRPAPARKHRAAHAVALGAVVAAATFSNPLVVVWVVAPLGAAVAVLVVARRLRFRLALQSIACLTIGPFAGMLGRLPMSRFFVVDADAHVSPGRIVPTVRNTVHAVRLHTASWGGVGETAVIVGLLVVVVALAVRDRRRHSRSGSAQDPEFADIRRTLVRVFAVAVTIVVPVLLVASGSGDVRYFQPVLYALLVAIASEVSHLLATHVEPDERRIRGVALLACVTSIVVVAGALPRIVEVRDERVAESVGVECLSAWVEREAVTEAGVGQFATVRPLMLWGDERTTVFQVGPNLEVKPWLVNLATYHDARIGYLLVAHGDRPSPEREALGRPAATVHCPTFDVLDYRDTAGQPRLDDRFAASVAAVSREHGFGS